METHKHTHNPHNITTQLFLPLGHLNTCPRVRNQLSLGISGASLVAQTVKNLPAMQEMLEPWVGKIPWRRKWQPAPVVLHGEFHGQRSLAGYSPWGHKAFLQLIH